MSGTKSRMASMQLAVSPQGGHDRKIALRRKDAADPLQDDRVPIRDDDSDAAHASPAYS
ncbi:hypothetical protein ACVWZ6_004621 [Bradyrhizobium sp. GM6.1]